MKSWYTIRARAPAAQRPCTEVLIYDEIGAYGVTAKGFLAELGALPNDAAIDLRLNSPGGSVFDAVAIYNALKRHTGEITVSIDGIAASAASYIAMAGDTIVMPENAFLMIHDPSGLVMGTAEDMRSTAEALDRVKGSLIQGYAAKSGKTEGEIPTLMAAETWLDANDALELGFINRLAEPVKLAASFDVARFRNAPPEVIEATRAPSSAETPEANPNNDAGTVKILEGEDVTKPVTLSGEPRKDMGAPNGNTHPETDTATAKDFNASAKSTLDTEAIRAEAIAHARPVNYLCRLAGQPQMAGHFLEEDVDLDAVRNRLLTAKAEAPPDISAAHAQPWRWATTQSWCDVIARTFKTKG